MKKNLVVLIAILAAVAVALPAFAVDVKYGGLYRLRWQSNDNVSDGDDGNDDNGNWIDQRLRMYFTFVGSENLQVVTKWEADTVWGKETGTKVFDVDGEEVTVDGAGRHGGGDIGADATNLEMKNVYLDFSIPNTPVRAKLGVQGASLLGGWMFEDDFSGVVLTTKFEPVGITLGYVAASNTDVDTTNENVDDLFIALDYANGPFSGTLVGWYQYAHDTNLSTFPYMSTGLITSSDIELDTVADNNLFNLGLQLNYKADFVDLMVRGIKNFGSYDLVGGDSQDYKGWMVDASANFYWNAFTFHLGGFYTTGDDDKTDEFDNANDYDAFAYARGASYYWSEILGAGTLDVSVAGHDTLKRAQKGAYQAYDAPSNLWMLTAGVAWQALEGTRLTFNYYYVGTAEDVDSAPGEVDDTIGQEVNFYLDQDVVDGLRLRLVGAYLFADDAYTKAKDDDDAYEVGAQLQWSF